MNLQFRTLCLLLFALPLNAVAQDEDSGNPDAAAISEEIESLEPSVGSDTLEDMRSEADPGTEDIEPGVVTADIRRTATGNEVMDELTLTRTEITGNQELPKVLYIVPWQKSGPGELMGKPVNTLLDEVLAPIDRSEVVREVDYYGDLHKEE